MPEEKRNLGLLMATFVLTEVLALIFANTIIVSQVPVEQYEPFGNENVVQATANSGILIASVLLFTLALIAVIKLGFRKIFQVIAVGMPVVFLFVFLVQQLGLLSLNIFKLPDTVANFLFVAIVAYVVLVVYSILKGIPIITASGFVLTCALIGSYLAVSISPPTLFVLPVAFALYDIYAVFKGPLKTLIKVIPIGQAKGKRGRKLPSKIITANLQRQFGLMLARIGGYTIGAGDFTFYSMLVAGAFVFKGLFAAFATGVSINIGIVATLWILQKYKRPLPGLPIPIALGIATMILV